MKISLNWLKDYVSINISPEKLAHKLTMAGMEVEKISCVDGDTVFELEITPNRPDCLNMLGIAREISAILNVARKTPKLKILKSSVSPCDVKILDTKGCLRYSATLVRDVRVAETPEWIRKRITALGQRSINNIVDITNFCLLETGQPLHAFDFDKLEGGKIVVRKAQEGETIITLDGIEHKLDPSILVIADVRRPVAIAGIMGGKATEVTAGTKNILLESAWFDPILIRRGARKLGISSDSSYRFERGVDYETVKTGAYRAIELILDSAGGTISGRTDKIVARKNVKSPQISLRQSKINEFLGTNLTAANCKRIFQQLGFSVSVGKAGLLKIKPPSFRQDIKEEVDLLEEIARIIGYDAVPVSLPSVPMTNLALQRQEEFGPAGRFPSGTIRVLLLGQGLNEVLTYTMISEKDLANSKQADLRAVKIQNPLAQDQGLLRPSLLPSLLSVVRFNINRGQKNLRLFEIGKIYKPEGEEETLGMIVTGRQRDDWRQSGKSEAEIYDLKGIIEQCLSRTSHQPVQFENNTLKFLEPGQSVSVGVQGVEVGIFGKVATEVLSHWDIKQKNVFFAQLNLEKLRGFYSVQRPYQPVTEYPAIVRDVSLAVKTSVRFQQICALASQIGAGLLDSVKFNEEYRGEKIPEGHRGLVFSLRYKAADRTLREEEVNSVHDKILRALITELDAIQR